MAVATVTIAGIEETEQQKEVVVVRGAKWMPQL